MSSSPRSSEKPGPVLLFDGECGLCNRVVRLLMWLDPEARLYYAPLQGPSAQAYLRAHGLPTKDFDTLIYVPDWSHRDRPDYVVRSAGVIIALRTIGGALPRTVADIIALFPAAIRDAAYHLVGHWRYRIFGPWRPRPLRRPEWAERLLP